MGAELKCPVCGLFSFKREDDGEACHICGWKNDRAQAERPDWPDGSNKVSLNEYKMKFTEWVNS